MELNGRRFEQFQQALLSAFPRKVKLAQMLSFKLDWDLDAIAGGQNQSEIIFNLINHAKTEGSLDQLLTAARIANPGNPALKAFAKPEIELEKVVDYPSAPVSIQNQRQELKAKFNRDGLNPDMLVNLSIFKAQIQEDEHPGARITAMNHVLTILRDYPEVLNTNRDIISIFQDRAQNDEHSGARITALNALPKLVAIL